MNRRVRITLAVLMIALLATFTFFMNCERETSTQVESISPIETDAVSLSKANNQIQSVMKVQNRHTKRLMEMEGVVGTATGVSKDGYAVIKIYAEHEDVKNLPKVLDGIPVEVVVTGMFHAYADPTAKYSRPVPIGVSTGHPDITAGTIGCRVKNSQGQVFALSNNHVYANCNDANIGDNELQPGPYDGGVNPTDAIGTLYDFQPITYDGSDNYIDAAIASTSTAQVGYSTPAGDGYGTPATTTVAAYVGQTVQKYGRTTGWTHGTVAELNVTVDVCYEQRGFRCIKLAHFVNQISITPGTFSDGGDSGSLIVTDNSSKNPVGLLYAGSDTRTLANSIDAVLQRFGVTIDNGSGGTTNVPPTADFTYTTDELTATFTDQSYDSDGSVVSYSWAFGDGATSTQQNPSHTYSTSGTYTVELIVTDNEGATGSTSKDVTVSTSTNVSPTADFTFTTNELTATFTDESYDSDGNVVSWSWTFGDGATSTQQNPSHTYSTAGTYTVGLTVTDDDGATGSISKDVTVSTSTGGDIVLTATGRKIRSQRYVDLEWTGAEGTSVDVYRNGSKVTTTENDGFYTEAVPRGTYTYQIFDGTNWSNEVTVKP